MRTRTSKQAIMVHDPSLTAWGWVVLSFGGRFLEAGCIKTEKQSHKLRIRKGDDDVRRIKEINQTFKRLIKRYGVQYMFAELPHGSQSSSAANAMGMVKAGLQSLCDGMDIGVEWYSEGDAKKSLFGVATASKDETMREIDRLYPSTKWTGTKYKDEAIADAMAIYHVAREQSETLKMIDKL